LIEAKNRDFLLNWNHFMVA